MKADVVYNLLTEGYPTDRMVLVEVSAQVIRCLLEIAAQLDNLREEMRASTTSTDNIAGQLAEINSKLCRLDARLAEEDRQ